MYKSFLKILLIVNILIGFLWAQNNSISFHKLDNGLEVLLIENPALPMVGVNVVVKVGSAYEDFSTSGMSHMLEHLLFNGTTSRTQKQLYDDVDRIGGYNNANTGDYYTNFMMVTPAENIRQGMEIQADMLFNSTLPENKFEKEKGIVLEEISKTFADPEAQLERNVNSILFAGHALSLPTLGTYATIKGLDRDQVFEFYKNFYVPNNMRMSVIGNFDSDSMLQMIQQIYGQQEPGLVRLPKLTSWSFAFDRSHLHLPAAGETFKRFYDGTLTVVQFIFPIGSQMDHIRSELIDDKLSQQAYELKKQLGPNITNVELKTISSPIANFVVATIKTNQTVKNVDEWRAKVRQFLQQMDFSYSTTAISAKANEIKTFFLKNLEKPHMFGIYNAQLIATIGFDALLTSFETNSIQAQARKLSTFKITDQPFTIIQYPKSNSKNKRAQLNIKTKLFKGQNGLPTIIVKQNPASQLVAIHYLIKHKAYWQSRYGKQAAQILHDCIGQRLKNEKNLALSQQFGLSLKVNDNPFIPMDDIYLHPDFGYIRVEGLNTDLAGLIKFLNDQLQNFIPTQQEFQKAQAKFSAPAGMMGLPGDPAKKRFDKLYKEHIYEPPIYQQGPDTISYQQLVEFAKNYFQPANMIISVVSSGSPQKVYPLFSSFKSKPLPDEPMVMKKRLKLHQAPVTIEKTVHGKRSYIFWGFSKSIDPNDHLPLKALSLLLGDKIVFHIREKLGMAYHMRAGIEVEGDRALFYVSQGTRPSNVETLLKEYPKFFQTKIISEFTPADLQKSINMYLGRMMFRRLSSINQAYYLAHSYYFHGNIDYDQKFLDGLKKVTLQDVQRVAQKYLKISNLVQIIVR